MSVKEFIRGVVNSRKRLNPTTETSSNFTFSFNRNVHRITEIVLTSIQIPYSFYSINATNNVLTFNDDALFITLVPGNYTSTSLTLALKQLIDSAFGDTTTVVTFSYSTYKITITRGVAFSVDSYTDVPQSTLSNILGFAITTATAISVTGINVINISGPNYINIVSNFLTKPIDHKVLYINSSYSNVLATIPVTVGPGNTITSFYQVSEPIRFSYKYSILTTSIIDFKITDEYGNILNLNGLDIDIQFYFITE